MCEIRSKVRMPDMLKIDTIVFKSLGVGLLTPAPPLTGSLNILKYSGSS